jgi:hypothetical protein
MNRSNSRRNYNIPSARKETRKQRGGGIFTSRIGGPVKIILDAVNDFVSDELTAIKKVVSSVFDSAADAVLGLSRGSNRVLYGVGSVLTGPHRKNRRTRKN